MAPETQARTHEIHWNQWGPELFDQAARQDKLILFDSGATWCHWCHVMDRVTYEDPEVVELINSRFIPVRIDRDRLPDVDAHYQRTRAILNPNSPAGGWPLTVVISPEGVVLFKGTFIPPRADPKFGRAIGLIEMLNQVDRIWRDKRELISASAAKFTEATSQQVRSLYERPGKLDHAIMDEIFSGLTAGFDSTHGGFGSAPKFFSTGSLEFLTQRAWANNDQARSMLIKTLEMMSRGGIFDQLGGGFHRYSVDERWHVPHFEKMAYDNAPLLAIYANAYALTGNAEFADTAKDIIRWMNEMLLDENRTGFYASQDADVGLDDDGGYFTWTESQVREIVGEDADVAISYYGVDPVGDMGDSTGKNVLHRSRTLAQEAKLLSTQPEVIAHKIAAANKKLLAARSARPAPKVDKTIFADINGMCIDAYLTAADRLENETARTDALAVLDSVMGELRNADGVFAHYRHDDKLQGIGKLADQAWMGRAMLSAYQITSRQEYLEAAEAVGDFVLNSLVDEGGAFLSMPDTPSTNPADIEPRIGWQDSPMRSAASVAAQMLTDLTHLTGEQKYADAAAKALASFAGGVNRNWSTFLGGYGVSVDHLLNGPRSVLVVGPSQDEATIALSAHPRRRFIPGAIMLALDPSVTDQRKQLETIGYAAMDRPVAYVCRGKSCLAPAFDVTQLSRRIDELAKTD